MAGKRKAPAMRLCEHPDFEQAILRTSEHFKDRGLRPAIIEKDYFVTEALRIIANSYENRVIFKGGTSLSKGWNLIHRFSEDIDIFFDPTSDSRSLSKNSIDLACSNSMRLRAKQLAVLAEETTSSTKADFEVWARYGIEFWLKRAAQAAKSLLCQLRYSRMWPNFLMATI
jgi:hypothetical protein